MMKFYIVGIVLVFAFFSKSYSQDICNLRAVQSGDNVLLKFDLPLKNKISTLVIYYSIDSGKNWIGPLTKISGNFNNLTPPLKDVEVIWDAKSEVGTLHAETVFKIDVNVSKYSFQPISGFSNLKVQADFKKHRTLQFVWGTSTIISAGSGIYAMLKSSLLYKEYQNSLDGDLTALKGQIETLDKITIVAFGVAGFCSLNYVIQTVKKSKNQKTIKLQPAISKNGSGFVISMNF